MKNKPEKPENTRSIKPDEGGQHAPDYPVPKFCEEFLFRLVLPINRITSNKISDKTKILYRT
jgi:hypothetical protein